MRSQFLQCVYAAGFAGMLALPAAASAQQAQGFTNGRANLRAGPAQDFPVVTLLPAGIPVAVYGCLDDYSWCDVSVPNARGWIYAGLLSYPYQGGREPVYTYGAEIGLPIIGFSIGSYWGSYYRDRPFYRDQGRWSNWSPPRGRPGGFRPGGGRPDYRPGNGRPGDFRPGPGRPGGGPGRPGGGGDHGFPGRPGGGDNHGGPRPGGGGDHGNPGRPGGGRPGGGDHGGGGSPGGGGDHGGGGRPGGGGGEHGGGGGGRSVTGNSGHSSTGGGQRGGPPGGDQ